MKNESLERAIAAAPGIIAFARALNVTHQAVTGWRKRGYMPPDRALVAEGIYGVSRMSLVSGEFLDLCLRFAAGSDVL